MKKLAWILCLLLLVACVPTPDREFVVYRGDGAATPAMHADLSAIPKHLTATETPEKGVVLELDADVEIDRSGTFPVLEVRAVDTVADPAFCQKLLSLLCPDGKVYLRWQPTKDELKEELLAAKSYDGRWGSIVDMEDMPETQRYFENAYQTAPDEPQRVPVDPKNGFEPAKSYYIERPDGSLAFLSFGSEMNGGTWVDEARTCYCTEDFVAPGDPPLEEPQLSEQDAIAKADALLAALGAECATLLYTQRGFGWKNYDRTESVWFCTYVRTVGTTRSLDQRNVVGYQYPRDSAATLGAPWEGVECIRIAVKSAGVCEVWWTGLSETTGVAETDAALLDFDAARERFVSQLGYQYAVGDRQEPYVIRIERIALTYGAVSEKDRRGFGLYIPMWELTYREEALQSEGVWKMYFSALDGSRVEPRITTDSLLSESQSP